METVKKYRERLLYQKPVKKDEYIVKCSHPDIFHDVWIKDDNKGLPIVTSDKSKAKRFYLNAAKALAEDLPNGEFILI